MATVNNENWIIRLSSPSFYRLIGAKLVGVLIFAAGSFLVRGNAAFSMTPVDMVIWAVFGATTFVLVIAMLIFLFDVRIGQDRIVYRRNGWWFPWECAAHFNQIENVQMPSGWALKIYLQDGIVLRLSSDLLIDFSEERVWEVFAKFPAPEKYRNLLFVKAYLASRCNKPEWVDGPMGEREAFDVLRRQI